MAVPLEIGTCGTVGSLLKIEIDYFRRVEVERVESCMNIERNMEETVTGGKRNSWRGLKFLIVPWRRKKKKNNRSVGICSMVDVADNRGMNEISGFSYRNLRADSMRFDV